jgi:aspartate aminotransferase
MNISNRLAAVQASLTMEISAKAKDLQAAGVDVISLSAGEPDFSPPETVHEAACAAIRANDGRYTATAGTAALRRAVAERTKKETGFTYGLDEIIVSSGAKQAIFNAIYAVCDPGTELIIPAPYWTSYPEMAQALEVRPVIWKTSSDDGFRLHAKDLAALITPKTRAVILNSPNNPTGAVISKEELQEIAEVLRAAKNVWIISDDIYDRLVFAGKEAKNILSVAADLRDRTLIVNGLSKTYCMTGWRVGYSLGPRSIIRAMEIIQGHTTSCANAIAQAASVVALCEAVEKLL